jgi:hypothetical protein
MHVIQPGRTELNGAADKDRLSCIRYASARYSVPTRLIGASVAVVVDQGAVCVVEPTTGRHPTAGRLHRRSVRSR